MDVSNTETQTTSYGIFKVLTCKRALGIIIWINAIFMTVYTINYPLPSSDLIKYSDAAETITGISKLNMSSRCRNFTTSHKYPMKSTEIPFHCKGVLKPSFISISKASVRASVPRSEQNRVERKAFNKRNISKSRIGYIISVLSGQSSDNKRGQGIDHMASTNLGSDFSKISQIKNDNSSIVNIDVPDFCKGVSQLSKNHMISTMFSRVSSKFLSRSGKIIVYIEAFDKRNISKSRGGDIFFIWAKQSTGDGRVPGKVNDHGNGSYTAVIPVFWTGRTNINIRLISVAENTCQRYKALKKYGNIAYTLKQPRGIRAVFRKKQFKEFTPCNMNSFIYGSTHVCNFTTLNGGMSWFCGRPTRTSVSCTDLISFSAGPYNSSASSRTDQVQDPGGHGIFNKAMSFHTRFKSVKNTAVSCNKRSPLESWTEPSPTGYFLNSHWELINCHSNLKHEVKSYRSCLRNKTFIMLGDSTVRQYVNFFLENVLGIDKNVSTKSAFSPNFETYHGENAFINRGISIIYRKQALPLYFSGNIPINGIVSFPEILDFVTASTIPASEIIVLLNYHVHFTMFPLHTYRERIRKLAKSLKRFLKTKSSAKVFFKGPTAYFGLHRQWGPHISLLYKKVLEEEFKDIMDKVTYLNVWEIGVAHNSLDIHPQGGAFNSQIHQIMSFIC